MTSDKSNNHTQDTSESPADGTETKPPQDLSKDDGEAVASRDHGGSGTDPQSEKDTDAIVDVDVVEIADQSDDLKARPETFDKAPNGIAHNSKAKGTSWGLYGFGTAALFAGLLAIVVTQPAAMDALVQLGLAKPATVGVSGFDGDYGQLTDEVATLKRRLAQAEQNLAANRQEIAALKSETQPLQGSVEHNQQPGAIRRGGAVTSPQTGQVTQRISQLEDQLSRLQVQMQTVAVLDQQGGNQQLSENGSVTVSAESLVEQSAQLARDFLMLKTGLAELERQQRFLADTVAGQDAAGQSARHALSLQLEDLAARFAAELTTVKTALDTGSLKATANGRLLLALTGLRERALSGQSVRDDMVGLKALAGEAGPVRAARLLPVLDSFQRLTYQPLLTLTGLAQEFDDVLAGAADARAKREGQFLAGLFRVRRTGDGATGFDRIVEDARRFLSVGDLTAASEALLALEDEDSAAFAPWVQQANRRTAARLHLDQLIAIVQDQRIPAGLPDQSGLPLPPDAASEPLEKPGELSEASDHSLEARPLETAGQPTRVNQGG